MKFEDAKVWKISARLSVSIYKELVNLKDYGFKETTMDGGNAENAGAVFCPDNEIGFINSFKYC